MLTWLPWLEQHCLHGTSPCSHLPPHPCPRSYYPLIVLSELLQQLISLWPALLHKIGFAEGYKLRGWRTATWSWVARAFPHPDDSSATPAAAEGGRAGKPAAAAAWGATCVTSDCTANPPAALAVGPMESKDGSNKTAASSAC